MKSLKHAHRALAFTAVLLLTVGGVSGAVIFSDNFATGSTLNSAAPAAPTATSTAYQLFSSKPWNPAPSLGTNDLNFGIGTTTSGHIEVQARFASTPATLTAIGQYLELTVVFTNTAGLFAQAGHVGFGLYNSGGVPPLAGGMNGSASSTNAGITGGAQGWQGYVTRLASTSGNHRIATRPAQTITTANNQDLLVEGSGSQSYTNGVLLGTAASTFTQATNSLLTECFRITLTATNTCQLDSRLYLGGDANGTLLTNLMTTASGTNFLTNSFDAFAIGWRDTGNAAATRMDIKTVTVNYFAPVTLVSTTNDSGAGSLRQVIADAPAGSIITFTNTLSGQTILLTSGAIVLTRNLAIDGSALTNGIQLNGNQNSAVFMVNSGTTNVLTSLTLTNGNASGVQNFGALTVNQCTIAGNTTTGYGAGIYSDLGTTLTVNRSTLAGNSCIGANGWYGGAIDVNRCTATINQCTLVGNSCLIGGGGIWMWGDVVVNQCTIESNTVTGNYSAAWQGGGGIVAYLGTLALTNSIIAGNDAISGPNLKVTGATATYGGHSFTNGDAQLAPLGNYGGPTPTMPPLPGSPVIDAGGDSVTNTFSTDQRGFPRLSGPHVDLGAVEYVQSFSITATQSANGSITPSGSITVSYGGSQTYAILPANGYYLAALTVDGVPVAPTNSYRFGNVTTNHTIDAAFALLPVVTFKANWPGFRGGSANDVEVIGNIAYVALGTGGLLIVDVSDPDNPRRIGSFDTPGNAQGVTVRDGLAYVADGPGGICIVDVHNPGLPFFIGRDTSLANTYRIVERDGYAYVADLTAGFRIFDVHNPSSPIPLGAVPNPASGVALSGNYAYVCTLGFGLKIVDVTVPTNPVVVGVWSGYASAVAVTNGYAYVCSFSFLRILSVTNPLNPTLVAQQPVAILGGAVGVVVTTNRAYVLSFEEANDNILEIDITDPANPAGLRSAPIHPFPGVSGLSLSGSHLYVSHSVMGLLVVDLSQNAAAWPTAMFPTQTRSFNVAVQGNRAYVAAGDGGLKILDISVPAEPALLGTATGRVYSVSMLGRYALIVKDSGMGMIDVSDPHHPQYVTGTNDPSPYGGAIVGISVTQDRLFTFRAGAPSYPTPESEFLNADALWLEIYGLADRTSPLPVTNLHVFFDLPFSYRSRSLGVVGNYAFLPGQAGDEFRVLDLANPALSFRQSSAVNGTTVVAVGNRAVLAGVNGLELFDISQPTAPLSKGRFGLTGNLASTCADAALSGQRILTTQTQSGLHIIEPSTGTNLVEIGSYLTTGFEKFAVAGNHAFLTQGDQGLTVLDLGTSFASAPAISYQPPSRRVLPGATVSFDFGCVGTVPVAYQWRFNGTNISGATDFVLSLTNVQSASAGLYSVVLSNSVGVTVSSNVVLEVDDRPQIAISNLVDGQMFLTPASVTIGTQASDSDGVVARIEFFAGTNSLGVVSNLPYAFTWTNVPLGGYVITAKATDNEGASSVSTPVNIIVTNLMVIQLSATNYAVAESNAVVNVQVLCNAAGAAAVDIRTISVSGKAVGEGVLGSYYAISNRITFGTNEQVRTVAIQLVNDLVYRGNKSFRVELSNPQGGWQLASPTNATVTIQDDDPPTTTNSFTDVVSPLPAPAGRGSLSMLLSPTNASGQWRFAWENAWRSGGSTVTNLVPGNYATVLAGQLGWNPINPVVTNVVAAGIVELATNFFNASGPVAAGALTVNLLPQSIAAQTNEVERGQWRLRQNPPASWENSGTVLGGIPAGAYIVEFKDVAGYSTPSSRLLQVFSDQTAQISATYLIANAPPGEAPRVLAGFAAVQNSNAPYQFNGQIISDAGYGSGFVVKSRTVLTAAHVTFDPGTLSYVPTLWWFFEKHQGAYDAAPQVARGVYVFAGYAAARTNDIFSGLAGPGESTTPTRRQDVAALYFFEDAGRGGYGGYLTTIPGAVDWLGSEALKLLVGYPMETVPESDRGRMHQTGPGYYVFEPLPGEPLYRSTDLKSYPGNSGGPLCVQAADSLGRPFFLPAGVYLGGTGESVARAIDADVVELINRAQASGSGGGNSTGGGVVQWVTGNGTQFNPGLFRVNLLPANAVALGAGWRVSAGANTNWINDSNYYYSTNPGAITLEFRPVTGFATPSNRVVNLTANQTTVIDVTYAPNVPSLLQGPVQVGNGGLQLTLSGTPGQNYVIQFSTNLSSWSDLLLLTNTTGTNLFTNPPAINSTRGYFRARQTP